MTPSPKIRWTVIAVLALLPLAAGAEDKVPLKTVLPKPVFVGTPTPMPNLPNLEPKLNADRPDFMVPAGTVNLAKDKKVTASDTAPVTGTLDLVTDGDKEGEEGSWVEFGIGKQWVQIDLEKPAEIHAILIWHWHNENQPRAYRDVVVQISSDPAFVKDVNTIYDNSSVGQDRPYIESNRGKLIDAKGVKGRYVRLYSNGNTTTKMNDYIEVEVWGKPAA